MKICTHCYTKFVGTLFIISLFITGVCSAAGQPDSAMASSPFELNATIMELDLSNKIIVVAEKNIHLLTVMQGGKMKWKTSFEDVNGNNIPVKIFKQRDRVLVKGEKTASGGMTAHSIRLLSREEVEHTRPSSGPVRLEGGVWVN